MPLGGQQTERRGAGRGQHRLERVQETDPAASASRCRRRRPRRSTRDWPAVQVAAGRVAACRRPTRPTEGLAGQVAFSAGYPVRDKRPPCSLEWRGRSHALLAGRGLGRERRGGRARIMSGAQGRHRPILTGLAGRGTVTRTPSRSWAAHPPRWTSREPLAPTGRANLSAKRSGRFSLETAFSVAMWAASPAEVLMNATAPAHAGRAHDPPGSLPRALDLEGLTREEMRAAPSSRRASPRSRPGCG
jgi:hypothetical protein